MSVNASVFRRIAAAFALAGCVLGLAGCNTVAGVGEDLNAAGRAIKRAADWTARASAPIRASILPARAAGLQSG
ncbi:hypothetical protein NCM_00796 [Burkholderia pseudomallei]